NVAGDVIVQLRGAFHDSELLIHDRRKRLVSDVNKIYRVVCGLSRIRDDKRDAFTDETDALDRHDRSIRDARSRDYPVWPNRPQLSGEVGPSKRRSDAGRASRCRKIHPVDGGVCMTGTQNGYVQHSWQFDVVDVAPLSCEEPEVLTSAERLAHVALGL